jgi:FAD synthetase
MTKSDTKIVLTGGCFDILHFGHIYFLKKAKALGNFLVVAIESDKNIKKLKGKGRPIHTQNQRKQILESLKFVDRVVILKDKMTDKDYVELVKKIRPSIIAVTKGDPILGKKREQARLINAKIVEIPKIKSPSTSKILEKITPNC